MWPEDEKEPTNAPVGHWKIRERLKRKENQLKNNNNTEKGRIGEDNARIGRTVEQKTRKAHVYGWKLR